MQAATRLADLWIGRKGFDQIAVEQARAAVAHLRPIVVVTGGSRGIGAALAMRFAKAHHDVALIARNAQGLNEAAQEISEKTNRHVVILIQDITDADAPKIIESKLAAEGYYIDVLINNAGMGLSGSFDLMKADSLDALISVNVHALTSFMRAVLPGLRARRRGGILNVASLGGAVPGPYQAAYYASKAFVISLTEAVAAEVSGEGVRIAALVPGPVNTSFHSEMGAENSRYRWALPSLSPTRVAQSAYRSFTLGQRVIIPGFFFRLSFWVLRLLPHAVSVPIMAWLLTPAGRT